MLLRQTSFPANFLALLLIFLITLFYLYNNPITFAPFSAELSDPTTETTEVVSTTTIETPRSVELDSILEQSNQLPPCDDKDLSGEINSKMELIKTNFLGCILPIVRQWKNRAQEMSLEWASKTKYCNELVDFQEMKIMPIANLHDINWIILPKCTEQNVLLTLGIGNDTVAEETLNRTLPNTVFYGADPIIEPNRRIYSAFGKFFPVKVGREPGYSSLRPAPSNQSQRRMENEENLVVPTIDIEYFLTDMLKLKKIDFVWIDMEGGEFELLDQLHRNGTLDNAGISICQFNLEVHSKFHPPGAQIFHDFIFRVLEEGRFVFMNSLHTDVGVHRMFFVNVEDEKCVAKYFSD